MSKTTREWSKYLRSESPRAQRLTKNLRNFELLIGDLELMTDQLQGNVRLYTVTGDPDDPEARFAGNIPNNFPLIASLQAAYDAKTIAVDDSVLGFALAGVAVRHLSFQEYMERDPDTVEKVLKRARLENRIDPKDPKFRSLALKMMEEHYNTSIVPGLPSPPNMPESLRVQAIVVSALMKDGLSFILHSNSPFRDGGMDVSAIDEEMVTRNMDFNSLYQFLNGVRPEVDVDPFARVQEFTLLKSALEGVSPEEKD